jgi:dolichyl-diphosphooligosaccharide--protein glycosyltransferase
MNVGGSRKACETAAWLAAFFAIALALRIGISYDAVFGHSFVRFLETDAWYHMRLVDATVRHFPHRLWFDPYLVHPGGEPVNAGPFFDWVIAAVALLLGFGSPSDYLVDVVGVYTPAVMGALFCVPVYVLGRELCSRRAGLWAAFIVGVLPGQILVRSMLGFTDHHCAETLLSTTALMWIVMALDAARPLRKRLWLSAIGGATLGCYLLTWSGGSLFILVIVASATASLILQKLRGEAVENLPLVLAPAFGIATVMVGPWVGTRPYFGYDVAALMGGLLLMIAYRAWGSATARSRHDRVTYLAGLAVSVGLVLAVAYVARGGWSSLVHEMARLSPWRQDVYVREALPLLRSEARYPFPLWNEFGSCLFLAVLGGAWYVARPRAGFVKGTLLVVWTGVMIAATFAQVRFTYYLAVNVALLAGFAFDTLLTRLASSRQQLTTASDPATGTTDPRRWRLVVSSIAGLALVLLMTMALGKRFERERASERGMPDEWDDAMQWLNANTPEPFNTADAYYRTEFTAPSGANHVNSTYGVLSWWDAGYWIIRAAHRVPNANPRQTQMKEVASFLLAERPAAASALLDALGSRYVVVDARVQARIMVPERSVEGFFLTIVGSAGGRPTDYCQEFETPGDGDGPSTRFYCFPKYYRSMAVRLYAFGGRAVTPRAVTAISWTDQERAGRRVRRLVDERTFGSFEEASRFIDLRSSEQWRIASADLLTSCVPLDGLPGYRVVFQSLGTQPTASGRPGPAVVQIYERLVPTPTQRQTQ